MYLIAYRPIISVFWLCFPLFVPHLAIYRRQRNILRFGLIQPSKNGNFFSRTWFGVIAVVFSIKFFSMTLQIGIILVSLSSRYCDIVSLSASSKGYCNYQDHHLVLVTLMVLCKLNCCTFPNLRRFLFISCGRQNGIGTRLLTSSE